MEPKQRTERTAFPNGPTVGVASVKDQGNNIGQDFSLDDEDTNFDNYFEGGDLKFEDDDAPSTDDIENAEKEVKKMTDEEIKIKALKQAVDVAKLMSDVTTDDVIDIAKKLAKFIKG